jgi:hypothetical protein
MYIFPLSSFLPLPSKPVFAIFSVCKQSWNKGVMIRVMVFNATFNNISAISWQSDLLVEETEVLGENHRPVASH